MKYNAITLFAKLLIGISFFAAVPTNAAINGKPVLFVHGLQTSHLLTRASDRDSIDFVGDSQEQAGVMANSFDGYITYPSFERLQGGIELAVYNQVKAIEASGQCAQGCFLVTASTGDLVTRYMLSRLGAWGIDSSRFRVLAVLDAVGAGGGTEIADVVVNTVSSNNPFSWAISAALSAWIGDNFSDLEASGLGVLHDLRPSAARNIATSATAVPHLKVAGGGKITPLVNATGAFILGGDDGVVPLHSACGARYRESIDSCANDIEISGRIRSADGPSWGYFHNQYPILMAEDMSHTQIGTSQPAGRIVAISSNVNRNFGGLNANVSERTFTTGRWWWKKTYREVNYNRSLPPGVFVLQAFGG